MAWTLTVGGVDYTPSTPLDSFDISDTGSNANGRLSARFENLEGSFGISPGASVVLTNGTAVEWQGRLVSRAVEPTPTGYRVQLEATDLGADLDRAYVVNYTSGTAIRTDKAIIQELFSTYGTAISVTASSATMTATSAELTNVDINGRTLRQGIEDVISASVSLPPVFTSWDAESASNFTGANAVAYGTGLYVVPGYAGSTATNYWSADGVTWSSNVRTIGRVNDAVYTAGTFVVLSGYQLQTSTSGTAWNTPGTINAGGAWVAATTSGSALTSNDGINWLASSVGTAFQARNIARSEDEDQWVLVGVENSGSGKIYTSANGTAWTSRLTAAFPISGVARSETDDLWVAVGAGGSLRTSPDAVTWTTRTSNVITNLTGVAHSPDNNLWVAVGESGSITTSTNGTAWTSRTSGTSSTFRGIARSESDDLWVAVGAGGMIRTSSDGVTWTGRTSNVSPSLKHVARSDAANLWVAVGDSGAITSSVDGITWTSRTSGTSVDLYSVAHSDADSQWVAVGASGTVITSTDGFVWTSRTSGVAASIFAVARAAGASSIAFNGATAVVTGDQKTAWTSTDLATFTRQTMAPAFLSAVTYGSAFVAVGAGGSAYTSASGTAWTAYSIGTAVTFNGVAYGTSTYVAVGSGGNIRYSSSGTAWSSATSGVSTDLYRVRYIDSQFVAVGAGGKVLTSASGTAWSVYDSASTATLRDVTYGLVSVAVGDSTLQRSADSPEAITYFVDRFGRLNYNQSAGTAPYAISDNPNGTTSVAAEDISIDYDESAIVNAVYMTSAPQDALYSYWVLDTASIAAYGRREAFVVNENVVSQTTADTYGNAYLSERNAPQVRGAFTVTGYDGWRAGQTVTISAATLGLSSAQFAITEVTSEFLTGTGTRRYRVSFGALPKSLVRLLAAS